jgi:hypothetical protein
MMGYFIFNIAIPAAIGLLLIGYLIARGATVGI